ncbi:MAG: glutathione-disulfide reductase [Gammaproteobacteria bacterium]|jgi:glutathione reductase (NADPH)|nr:glutathione-disulfide reductase [Gammaproteobacteria bacterium]MBT4147071.1 glutathione-disulfide reductase [Gammaproteobacteria bacterium]MBT5222741.1 glutathione-disulfide reductase [Gammaproteobacteria bacterium]MBT5827128.1 glutathione-disulfide reductase [Gammaproteobacteria bacterium]MBT5967699.1 glutathione-disulfide reductase [Gammaproteobacteria bacterium]
MTQYDYDLFVIGAGSGGVRAARMAAGLGVRVAIAEDRYLGGTCVNVGCVPKKLFVYASHFHEDFSASAGFGWTGIKPEFDWSHLMAQKNQEIKRLQGIYDGLIKNSGARLFEGQASVIDAHTISVVGQIISCERILVATGGWPSVPDFPGKEHVATSNEMFALQELPKRLMIVGGGYIAVEFAGIMHGLGVETTLCYRGDKILRGFDEDIREFVAIEMQKKGINILFNTQVNAIEKNDNGFIAQTDAGQSLQSDLFLYATGRSPNTSGLGLDAVGVALDKSGAIKVNEHYQTNVSSIYALGDVTDRLNLTPVATAEAMALVNQLYTDTPTTVDYDNIPTAVFSQPNVGTVGLSEAEAKSRYTDIDIYKSAFTPMKHTLSGLDEKTLMKMIVRRSTDQVLGIHMVGPDAGEIIQGMAIAIRAGATKTVFDSTIGIHPTAAEEFVTMRSPVG